MSDLSFDDLRFFVRLYEVISASPTNESGIRALPWTRAQTSKRLKSLEAMLGVKLVNRTPRRKTFGITPAGRKLFTVAIKMLDSEKSLDRIGTSLDEVAVAATAPVLSHYLPESVASFRATAKSTKIRFRECDSSELQHLLLGGEVDFAIGPHLKAPLPGIRTEPIDQGHVLCLATHPSHPVAIQFANGRTEPLRLSEIMGQELIRIARGLNPDIKEALAHLLSPVERDRVEVMNYSTILALVRMGDGAGVLPLWRWVLDEHRKHGELFYAPILESDLPKEMIAVYMADGIPLSDSAGALLQAIISHRGKYAASSTFKYWRARKNTIPSDLGKFCYEYHMTCNRPGYGAPEWHSGRIELVCTDRRLEGTLCDLDKDSSSVVRRYVLRGELGDKFMCWSAVNDTNGDDQFAAAINSYEGGCLVGCWLGTDEQGEAPLAAPMVLSTVPLTSEKVREIARRAMLRFLVNPSSALLLGESPARSEYDEERVLHKLKRY